MNEQIIGQDACMEPVAGATTCIEEMLSKGGNLGQRRSERQRKRKAEDVRAEEKNAPTCPSKKSLAAAERMVERQSSGLAGVTPTSMHLMSIQDAQRLRQKELQLQQPSSSLRETQISAPTTLFSKTSQGGSQSGKVGTMPRHVGPTDIYLMKLLGHQSAVQASKQTSVTEFRMPEPVTRVSKKSGGSQGTKSAEKGAQASNSDKDKSNHGGKQVTQWTYADTQAAMGQEATETLRSSVVHHQKMYLEQIYDLHRAMAVQKLLVRHAPDLKKLVGETNKHMLKSRKSGKHGAQLETSTSLQGGLHPDSQFAALPLSKDTATGDRSGDDLTGSGDDIAGSGSGGNGNGNGSGGGSTSPQNNVGNLGQPQGATLPVQKSPSGASNAPMLWQQPPPGGMPPGWNGTPHPVEIPGNLHPYAPPYGPDPLMWWYQDYYSKMNSMNSAQTNEQNKKDTGAGIRSTPSGPYKWWQDPRVAFGAPADAAQVLAKGRSQNQGAVANVAGEVESAPPLSKDDAEKRRMEQKGPDHKPSPPKKPASKSRMVAPARQRKAKRKPADPVEEASSGTTGPNHHIDSIEGIMARSPRSGDAKVARLLLSFSKEKPFE